MPEIRAFSPEADTYVSEAAPDTNFGRSLQLRACGSPQTTAYLRFRLKKLPKHVTSVILLLHTRAAARTSYEIRRAERLGWREQGLTYANAPRPSMRYAAAKMVRSGAWAAVDVTRIVAGRTRVTLAITTRSHSCVAFYSRESKLGPRLVVRAGDGKPNLGTLLP
jgi:acid phosphatase type 7